MLQEGDVVIYVGEDTEYGMCGYVLSYGQDREVDGYTWHWLHVQLHGYGDVVRNVKDWIPVHDATGTKYNMRTNVLPDPYI